MKRPYLVTPGSGASDDQAFSSAISPIEEIIEDARNGRPYILVDAEDRETEGDVDISRMAGLNPAGVICEVMKDDGSMARLPDLVAFAQLHGLKIGAIADLIAHRRRTERQVERVLETPFNSTYGGRFRMVIYRNSIDQTEHVVLTKGRIEPDKPTLVRMHRVDLATDMLGAVEARREYVPNALKAAAEYDGAAVTVFIRDSN